MLMKPSIKYLSASCLIVTFYSCFTHLDPCRCSRASDIKHTYLMSYQKEITDIARREMQIAEQNKALDTELLNAQSSASDPIEAGMKESFQEGINAALKVKNNKEMAAMSLQRESVHLKYHKMILKAGYDWTEYEQLMCLSHDPGTERKAKAVKAK